MGHLGVVRPGEACDRIEEDDDVVAKLDQALGFFDHHLGDLDVARRLLVEGRGDDLDPGVGVAAKVRDLFGAFIDEEDDDLDVGRVDRDRLCDLLEEDRLARAGRGDDERTLTVADRCDEVDNAALDVVGCGFEKESAFGVEGGEVLKVCGFVDCGGFAAVDLVDAEEGEVAFALLGRADEPSDDHALAEAEASDL